MITGTEDWLIVMAEIVVDRAAVLNALLKGEWSGLDG